MFLIVILSSDSNFSLFGMLNFQKWMGMLWSCFTFLAKIKLFTNWTFVTNSFKIFNSTFLTSNFMNNFFLFNWNFTFNLTFDWASNWRLFDYFLFDFFDQLGHKLFEFALNFSLSYLNLIWQLFFWDYFLLFLLWSLWLFDNMNEIFLLLSLLLADFFSKFLDLIIKLNLGSLIEKFKLRFFDEDFDNFIWGLSHDFEVFLIWECDLIILIIKIRKLEGLRKGFEGTLNIRSEST